MDGVKYIEHCIFVGDMEPIEYYGQKYGYLILWNAIKYCYPPAIEYIAKNNQREFDKYACYMAIHIGQFTLLKYLIAIKTPSAYNLIEVASGVGRLDMVKYLIHIGYKINHKTFSESLFAALMNKHIDVANFLIGIGETIDPDMIRGRLSDDVVELLSNDSKFIRQGQYELILEYPKMNESVKWQPGMEKLHKKIWELRNGMKTNMLRQTAYSDISVRTF